MENGNPCVLLARMQTGVASMENRMEFPQKVKKWKLSCNPTTPVLGIQPKKKKTLAWKDICTPTCTEELFATANTWKQCKCPSMVDWIKKMKMCMCIYTYTQWSTIQP